MRFCGYVYVVAAGASVTRQVSSGGQDANVNTREQVEE